MGNRSLWLAVMVSALVVTPDGALYAQDSPQKVTSIEVQGNKRIEESAIRSRLTLNVGDPYTAKAIRAQIRLIYAMGFFEDVQIEAEPAAGGLAVILVVREKPFITEIVFDGNENLNEDKLREKTTVRSRSFLDQQEVKESAERIESAYRDEGYANARVIPIIQTLEEDRKRLTFYIKEGDQLKIETVIFDGAEAVPKKELLKMLANRETVFFLSLFTDAGILRREELANDVERIKEVYLNKGYLNVQVSLPVVELTEDRQGFTVTYTIVEGEPFTVGEVGFRGNTVFEEQELMKESKIKPGQVFQRDAIREEKTRLEDLYGGKGYAFARVTPSVVPNPETKTAAIIFRIEEGEMMRVNRITIRGNDKTRDNVIRRELRINEQEVIDTKAMKRSFQRLNNLNFFETVEIFPRQVASDKVDLDVKVKEKPTGSFSIGGGFSSLDRLTAIADITEGNLFGRGHLLRVRGQLGQRR
ncbi:MAG: outer membrane protein assembly factor BamA, partial [Nitrospirales bacterium]